MKIKLALAALGAAAITLTVYPTAGQVTYIAPDNEYMILRTATGYEYIMDDPAEDTFLGDIQSMIMWDYCTPDDITDDIIIMHRYSGFFVEIQG